MKFAPGLAVFLIALITHLCVVYGLAAICPAAIAGLFVGGLVAMACRSHWSATLVGTFLGLLGGSFIAQPWFLKLGQKRQRINWSLSTFFKIDSSLRLSNKG